MSQERARQIWRRLRLRDLETFQAIAEAGSMAKAARRLGLSQPAISKTVQELEATLGVSILDRTHQGVEVTSYGQVLINHARILFDDLSKGVAELTFMQDPTHGHLRVGAPEPATHALARMMTDLLAHHPNVTFEVIIADTSELFRALRERTVDVVLTRLAGPAIQEDLEFQPVFSDPLVIIAGSRNPLAKRKSLQLSELVDEPWVLPPRDTVLAIFAEEIFRSRKLRPPSPAIVAASFQMRLHIMMLGRHLSLAPLAMLSHALSTTGVRPLPVVLPETSRPVGLLTLAGRSKSPIVDAFLACATNSKSK